MCFKSWFGYYLCYSTKHVLYVLFLISLYVSILYKLMLKDLVSIPNIDDYAMMGHITCTTNHVYQWFLVVDTQLYTLPCRSVCR